MIDENNSEYETTAIDKAENQLSNLGLSWQDLEGKTVLDAGSGKSNIAIAAKIKQINTRIINLDKNIDPQTIKTHAIQSVDLKDSLIKADIDYLPLQNGQFDLIISHSVGPTIMKDGPRLLKQGGEIRCGLVYPNDSFVRTYLKKQSGSNDEEINRLLSEIKFKCSQGDTDAYKQYEALEELASDQLSDEEKMEAIESTKREWEKDYGLTLQLVIVSLNNYPEFTFVYKKP